MEGFYRTGPIAEDSHKDSHLAKEAFDLRLRGGARDLSTTVVLRIREAQPPLKMTLDRDRASISERNHVYISVLENFGLERFVKSNRATAETIALNTSRAEAQFHGGALTAALKGCATRNPIATGSASASFAGAVILLAALVLGSAALAQTPQDQDKDADQTAVPAAAAKKNQKKDQKKGDQKEAPASEKKDKDEEKKPGMNAETFSGLKFRSIGPAVASGRVMSIAVNPKNKFEYYVGVASGGVWKTVNDGTTWTPLFDKEGRIRLDG
jgi:hypothetical protein